MIPSEEPDEAGIRARRYRIGVRMLQRLFSRIITASKRYIGDSSSLIIENALALSWILIPPQSISIG